MSTRRCAALLLSSVVYYALFKWRRAVRMCELMSLDAPFKGIE